MRIKSIIKIKRQQGKTILATGLSSAYYKTSLIRKVYAIAKYASNIIIRPVLPALHNWTFVDLKRKIIKESLKKYGKSNNAFGQHIYTLSKPSSNFQPKVSIIVPNFNHAPYLRLRLESIYQQTYQNYEVILLDDKSNDDSIIILEEFQQQYPEKTLCYFNESNSGGVFHQWNKGFELATGELIWIAESDDYCSKNLLDELIPSFANNAVMIAFARTVFVKDDTTDLIWSTEEYMAELDTDIWRKPFLESANHLVNSIWGIKNIVPNVSSAVFRHPGEMELLRDDSWRRMRICGDWVFYLTLIRGGLVSYTPVATNYYRIHDHNTSIATHKRPEYYKEHEIVASTLICNYRLLPSVLEKQEQVLKTHWLSCRNDFSESSFKALYDLKRVQLLALKRKPNLLMVTYAMVAGGGETFPVRLSNLLKKAGWCITLLNCHCEPTEKGVRQMLRSDIPLLELDQTHKLPSVIRDMGIELTHSHHAWVDMTICSLLEEIYDCGVVISMHGMYEMMLSSDFQHNFQLLKRRVNHFVYAADKNMEPFRNMDIDFSRFTQIGNALEIQPIESINRSELGLTADDFVLCMVSRAIPDKGWKEAIESVKIANSRSNRSIHLLVIGEGPEYDRLILKEEDSHIHFLGFKSNIRDYYAVSDIGFLPTKFHGESFPLVLIDCLQSNRPMIATDIGAIKSMLESGSGLAGGVFSLENWEIPIDKVASMIVSFSEDSKLYAAALKCVSTATKKFDPYQMRDKYEAVYALALNDLQIDKE